MAVLATLLGVDAFAQQLEEVVVTAQKREESVQEVPISVFTTDGQALVDAGLWRMTELSDFVPNLVVQDSIGSSILSVRGLATLGFLNPSFEMSTGMFHDGVYMGKTRQSGNHFLDVERVEVLRGPQPTYFGQGAIAGAISVISARPGERWEGYLRGGYGSDEEARLDFAYGGPVSDALGVRVALGWYDTEGYFPFTYSGTKGPSQENLAGRVIAEWAPGDTFELSLIVESQRTDMYGVPGSEQINCDFEGDAFCALVAADPRYDAIEWRQNYAGSQGGAPIFWQASGLGTGYGPFAGLAGVTLGMLGIVPPGHPAFDVELCPTCGDILDVSAYRSVNDMGRDTENDRYVLGLEWDLGFATLSSQTAYQEFFSEIGWELDGTAVAGFGSHQEDDQEQFSQELRLASAPGGALEWMLGLYYQDVDFNTWTDWVTAYDGGQYIAVTSPLAPYRFVETDIDERFVSLFGSFTWSLSDTVSIDVGARWTDVEKDAVNVGLSRFIDPDGNPATADFGAIIPGSEQSIAKSFSDSSLDPSVALNWDVGDSSRVYLRFAQGFKSGGFGVGITIPDDNPDTPVDEQDSWIYDSEEAEMLELGFKTRLLDDRLALNVALFDTDFTNLQVSAFDPDTVSFLINNAASAHSRGIEVEGEFLVTDRLRLGYGLVWLDAEYDRYPDAQCSKFETSSGATCDRSGEDLEYSSDWSVMLGLDYTMPMGERYELRWNAQAAFYDEYALMYGAPNSVQDDYEKINLLLALAPRDGAWEIAAYGRNITDSRTVNTLSDGVANGPMEQSFSSNRGESYGVQFSYRF